MARPGATPRPIDRPAGDRSLTEVALVAAAISVLLVLVGVFALCETILVHLPVARATTMVDEGEERAERLVGLLHRREAHLSAVLVGRLVAQVGVVGTIVATLRTSGLGTGAWLGVAASLALVVGCSMLSITMPIEVPIGAVATGTFVSLALVISVHREGFKALVDRALEGLLVLPAADDVPLHRREIGLGLDLGVPVRVRGSHPAILRTGPVWTASGSRDAGRGSAAPSASCLAGVPLTA